MAAVTARALADEVMECNQPYDYAWLRYIKRKYTEKQKREWAKSNIEAFAPKNASNQLIGRAASILLREAMELV